MQRLHNHAFYLFGVVVGLGLREILVRGGAEISRHAQPWQLRLEAYRFIIYVVTIACFYFGCGLYFDEVHLNPDIASGYKTKNYGVDYSMGLFHFVLFFGWALTINDYSRLPCGMSWFETILTAIFLYDLVWLVTNRGNDSFQRIKLWAVWCLFTAALATAVFFLIRSIWHNDVAAEEISFIVYFSYLALDVTELFSGKPFSSQLIRMLLPKNS